jgi:hypothetical protein
MIERDSIADRIMLAIAMEIGRLPDIVFTEKSLESDLFRYVKKRSQVK